MTTSTTSRAPGRPPTRIDLAAATMRPGARLARLGWLGYWNLMRRYHRYGVEGLAHLDDLGPRAALIVGYHGRPVAHDLCMLQPYLLEREGRMPRAVIHRGFRALPILRDIAEGMEFVWDAASADEAVRRGDRLIVTPGGTREGCRPSTIRYRVDWGERTGYLKLAVRHRLPIVPTGARGVDDTYVGLNDGDAWSRRLHVPLGLPLWIGLGPLGPWPLSPPLPVRITTLIGAPIDPAVEGVTDPGDREGLAHLHHLVMARVQALLDAGHAPPPGAATSAPPDAGVHSIPQDADDHLDDGDPTHAPGEDDARASAARTTGGRS